MIITKPAVTEYPQYYEPYIKAVKENDLLDALRNNLEVFNQLVSDIPIEKGDYRYAEGKWTVKEVLMHVTDVERIFAYRALTFARNDKNELPGFDEDAYVPYYQAEKRTIFSIEDEFESLRNANIALFKSFDEETLNRKGMANRNMMSVRSVGFMLAGHAAHHVKVVRERYLNVD
jgi:uncharacterized damage-inducible protein DinB